MKLACQKHTNGRCFILLNPGRAHSCSAVLRHLRHNSLPEACCTSLETVNSCLMSLEQAVCRDFPSGNLDLCELAVRLARGLMASAVLLIAWLAFDKVRAHHPTSRGLCLRVLRQKRSGHGHRDMSSTGSRVALTLFEACTYTTCRSVVPPSLFLIPLSFLLKQAERIGFIYIYIIQAYLGKQSVRSGIICA